MAREDSSDSEVLFLPDSKTLLGLPIFLFGLLLGSIFWDGLEVPPAASCPLGRIPAEDRSLVPAGEPPTPHLQRSFLKPRFFTQEILNRIILKGNPKSYTNSTSIQSSAKICLLYFYNPVPEVLSLLHELGIQCILYIGYCHIIF